MFRFGATRLGAGAAAAAAGAAASTATSSQAHARARPARVALVAERAQDTAKLEEDWLGVDLEGEEIVFQPEEVREAIEDIFNVSSSPLIQEPDDDESVESFGHEADKILEENIVPTSSSSSSSAGIEVLANFTEKLLTRQSVQRELLSALKEDDEMREMFSRMTGTQTPMLPYTPRAALPPPEEVGEVQVVEGNDDMNPFQAVVHDIGKGLEAAGDNMKRAGDAVGNFLGRTGRWLKHRVARIEEAVNRDEGDNVEYDEPIMPGEKVAGAALCLAGAVMVVLVARRFGILRVFRVVV